MSFAAFVTVPNLLAQHLITKKASHRLKPRCEVPQGLRLLDDPKATQLAGLGLQRQHEHRDRITGLEMTFEPKFLRFFQARFKPLAATPVAQLTNNHAQAVPARSAARAKRPA